jgi:hypothetical protein
MSWRNILLTAAGVLALLAISYEATAATSQARTSKDTIVYFRMPSNNIFCSYVAQSNPYAKYLRCDIMSGLKPKPSSRGCVEGVRGFSADIGVTGRATYECSSDSLYNTSDPVLKYGHLWRHGAFSCRSRKVGLECWNKSQHGFFLSRQHSNRF